MAGRSTVEFAQVTLQHLVVVLDRTAGEPMLVQAGREASLLRRRVDQRVVQPANHLVRDTLERPWPQAYILWKLLTVHGWSDIRLELGAAKVVIKLSPILRSNGALYEIYGK